MSIQLSNIIINIHLDVITFLLNDSNHEMVYIPLNSNNNTGFKLPNSIPIGMTNQTNGYVRISYIKSIILIHYTDTSFWSGIIW